MSRRKALQVTSKLRAEIMQRDKQCIICGSKHNLTISHFISKGRGGMAIPENLTVLCMLCHHELDNGKNTLEVRKLVKAYLDKLYPNFPDELRIYNKWR